MVLPFPLVLLGRGALPALRVFLLPAVGLLRLARGFAHQDGIPVGGDALLRVSLETLQLPRPAIGSEREPERAAVILVAERPGEGDQESEHSRDERRIEIGWPVH